VLSLSGPNPNRLPHNSLQGAQVVEGWLPMTVDYYGYAGRMRCNATNGGAFRLTYTAQMCLQYCGVDCSDWRWIEARKARPDNGWADSCTSDQLGQIDRWSLSNLMASLSVCAENLSPGTPWFLERIRLIPYSTNDRCTRDLVGRYTLEQTNVRYCKQDMYENWSRSLGRAVNKFSWWNVFESEEMRRLRRPHDELCLEQSQHNWKGRHQVDIVLLPSTTGSQMKRCVRTCSEGV
jgi:hypothetical protein